jgi:dethiobiotin synthetase
MIRKPARGLFVTGTSTEVGKTYVASQIARQLARSGRAVGVYKPAASGCAADPGRTGDDDYRLWEAAGRRGELSRVCPQRFTAPLAPHLAARQEGKAIDSHLLADGIAYWSDQCEMVLVEGAGGYLSPISDQWLVADVALRLGYPLVIVAANSLGVINHVLQTVWVARSYGGGLPVAGVVLSDVQERRDASGELNEGELRRLTDVPLVVRLPFGQPMSGGIDWWSLADARPWNQPPGSGAGFAAP